MIEFLQKLIKIQSLSPRDEGCFDLIEERLVELDFKCERINYANVENLYAAYGNKGKLFCFLGHTDVVPTGQKKNGLTLLSQPRLMAIYYMAEVQLI